MSARSLCPFVLALFLTLNAQTHRTAAQSPQSSGNPQIATPATATLDDRALDFEELDGAPIMCTGELTEPDEIVPKKMTAQPASAKLLPTAYVEVLDANDRYLRHLRGDRGGSQ